MVDMPEAEAVQALRNESYAASVKRSVDEFKFRVILAGFRSKHK